MTRSFYVDGFRAMTARRTAWRHDAPGTIVIDDCTISGGAGGDGGTGGAKRDDGNAGVDGVDAGDAERRVVCLDDTVC